MMLPHLSLIVWVVNDDLIAFGVEFSIDFGIWLKYTELIKGALFLIEILRCRSISTDNVAFEIETYNPFLAFLVGIPSL